MEAKGRARRIPARGGAVGGAVERDREALEAAPGGADPEQLEAVEHRLECPFRSRLEHDREQPRRALEVALPDRVAGIALERRVEHASDLRSRSEPARHVERLTLV